MRSLAPGGTGRPHSVIARALVIATAAALFLAGCSITSTPTPKPTPHLDLKLGALVPQTGGFEALGPAETAGITAAAEDITQASLGITVDVDFQDSGDATNAAAIAKASATTLLAKKTKVDAIVGPTANDVTTAVVGQVTGAGVVMISPQSSAASLTSVRDDGLFWRTAPSDALEGTVLGSTIAKDGAKTLGLIVLNDDYGTAVSGAIASSFEKAGGTVTKKATFAATDTQLSAQVAEVVNAKPDAVALVVQSQAAALIPALIAGGIPAKQLYLTSTSLTQYGTSVAVPMAGVTGTAPGPTLDPFFRKRLLEVDPSLTAFAFAPESYDAVVLLALGALAANSTDGAKIAAKLQQVSGGSGSGEKATDFASAAQIVLAGDTVDYDGYSGKIGFDKQGDPAQATIGLFRYGADNRFTRVD